MKHPKTYVIAEMASSHDGSLDKARAIIDGAGNAGADAIQFQIWQHAEVVVPQHADYPVMKRIQLSQNDWTVLRDHVRQFFPHMQIIACIYEPESMRLADEIGCDAFKIHSADLSNPTLLKAVARTGKRIDLSVGGSTLAEIEAAVHTIGACSESAIWLMYGLQLFPTDPTAIHLRYAKTLGDLFGLPVGYQDHSEPTSGASLHLSATAIGMGIPVLEKHITHDRSLKGVDHQAALNPDEFTTFINMVREIDQAIGDSNPRPLSDAELRYRQYSKKSIVTVRELAPGETLCADDLRFMRAPETGLSPDRLDDILGRPTRVAIPAFGILSEESVQ
jgi:N,N'-diacetyllegionaminate synthase